MLGLLGGAFDPPHVGHVALARGALERFALARLSVLVVAAPAHKPVETPVEIRLELARAAFAGVPRTEVERDEHAYTVESLRAAALDPDAALFVVGADEFASFLEWREPDAILDLARLAVGTRPGHPRERLEPVLRSLRRPERVELFEIAPVDVSSTEVRRRVGRGEPVAGLVPEPVERLIVERGLYHGRVDRPSGAKLR